MHLQVMFDKAHVPNAEHSAQIFRQLLDALEHDTSFDLQLLYQLPYADFDLALNALREWRSQRYVWLREHPVESAWRSHAG
ncbi:hypothetical protein [Methyloversatilis universalis]|uniref:hypothetical protein n=1 Tax=Methyloversatilis universalis TaxID=378211 RepID=UPI0003AB01E4|nr:hypothetical protein [Methyloversatilis universalis]